MCCWIFNTHLILLHFTSLLHLIQKLPIAARLTTALRAMHFAEDKGVRMGSRCGLRGGWSYRHEFFHIEADWVVPSFMCSRAKNPSYVGSAHSFFDSRLTRRHRLIATF